MQVCLRVCCHNASLLQLLQELIDWAFDKPQPASNADASAPSDHRLSCFRRLHASSAPGYRMAAVRGAILRLAPRGRTRWVSSGEKWPVSPCLQNSVPTVGARWMSDGPVEPIFNRRTIRVRVHVHDVV